MKTVTVENLSEGRTLAGRAQFAAGLFDRLKGLLGRASLPAGEGMVITPCNSVHTFFMRFPIDVVFFDSDNTVIAAVANMRPFRATRIYWGARGVIELPAGTLETSPVSPGDRISIEDLS